MKVVKLKELTLRITDGKHGDCKNEDGSGFYFVSCKDVFGDIVHYENARQITKDDFIDANKRTDLAPNDILITNSGTIGRMAIVKDIPETKRTTFQKSVAIVRADTKNVLPHYLYYLLKNKVSFFINSSNGSAQKNLLLSTMRNFEIEYVDNIKEQERIITTLSRYDSLIENYQKQIRLLEEAAQRLYKEWFVNLRFPGHANTNIVDGVPEGWEKKCVGDIVEMNPKRPLKKGENATYLDMGNMPTSGSFPLNWEKKSYNGGARFQNGDVLMARITPCLENGKTALVSFLKENEIAFGSTEYIVLSPKSYIGKEFLYCFCRTESFVRYATNHMVGASGRQRVSNDVISKYELIIPPVEIAARINSIYGTIFDRVKFLSLQIRHLTEARDRLLPKLMSGEIEV